MALTRDECWERLRSGALGHLAFTIRAMPVIRPMRYVVTGLHLLLAPSDELAEHVDGQVVAFEIDAADASGGYRWSVVAVGTARLLQDPGEIARVAAHPFASWWSVESPSRVLLTIGELSGRTVLPHQPVPA